MHHLISSLRSLMQGRPKPDYPVDDPVVAVINGHVITQANVDELQYRLTAGYRLREQQELHAQECCFVLGVNPHEDSIERDWCNEIVLHGTDPAVIIQRLLRMGGHGAA